MNWLDAAIAVSVFIFIIKGLQRGFLIGLIELSGLVVAVSIPLLFYIPAGRVLEDLGISPVYSGALGFLIIFFITISIYYMISEKFYRWIPGRIIASPVNKVFGLFTGMLKGIIVVTLLLALIIALPVPFITSQHVEESNFGSPMLDAAAAATSLTAQIFGESFRHAMGFFTIEVDAVDGIDLQFTVADPVIDQEVEMAMLDLLNRERVLRGLPELVMDETLREVARQHSLDMFQRGYFSHIDPEGVTPFERMQAGGVSFVIAGENLALAPTVFIAHEGLMDSPGHRENILRSEFRRVGIGAVRNGRYGIMFTQNFAN
jgi:uncharacterized protein YkwD